MNVILKGQAIKFALGIIIGTVIYLFVSRNHNATYDLRSELIEYLDKKLEETRFSDQQKEPTISQPKTETPKISIQSNNSLIEENSESLYNRVKVLCWILTTPKYHKERAIHIKNTWGKRCNKLVFMSTKADPIINSEALNVTESYNTLWGKTKKAMELIYKKYLHEADWFFKADDDTYAIMENLRSLLKDYNSDEGHYFGCNFRLPETPYMSGGAGYVLSKGAVKKFVEEALPDKKKCKKSDLGFEDLEMGKCLRNVNITGGDSRDKFGRYRFLSFPPTHFLIPGLLPSNFWWWRYIAFPQKKGIDCCSKNAISFHYVKPDDLYLFDFLLYHLRPVGVKLQDTAANSNALIISTTTTTSRPSLQTLNNSVSVSKGLRKTKTLFPKIINPFRKTIPRIYRSQINKKVVKSSSKVEKPVQNKKPLAGKRVKRSLENN